MPKVEKSIISNKDKIVSDIGKIIKKDNILSHQDEIRPYETDALAAYRQAPLVVAPYFRECTPPEFSATFPPIEQAI